MKLKSFNPTNIPASTKSGIPKIALNSKSGTISFTKFACEKLGLKLTGAQIEFFQDEKNKEDWYISESKVGFVLRAKDDKSMLFNATFLVKSIFESKEYLHHTGHVLIAAEPVKINNVDHWPLITSTLKNPE